MKYITSSAAIVALTAALGVVSIAPSFAQSAPTAQGQFRHGDRHQQFSRSGGALLGNLLDFRRGAEGIEVALVRLSHRITLSAEQQPLFDSFKTAAIAAATEFATARAELRPDATTTTAPSLSERLDNQIALQQAQLKTLETLQPSAKAFFDSLTPEQLTQLRPDRADHADRNDRGDRDGRRGFGDHGRPGYKGQAQRPAPDAAPAPTATPAPTAPATPG
jgi:hypothetical protein